MSPSWNKLLERLWPRPEGVIGLGFSGNRIVAVRADKTNPGFCASLIAEEQLPFQPFRSPPRPGDDVLITQALQRLAKATPQNHWPLQIALPNPACLFEVLEFDSLPASTRERIALARFRLEKEFPAAFEMECVIQELGEDDGRALLLAMAADRAWLDLLSKGCQNAGLYPGVVDLAASHTFNRFHDLFLKSATGGVLLMIEADSWTILFFDECCRPRFLRSRWREAVLENAPEHDAIAKEVERLVRAYALAAPKRKIGAIYIQANEQSRNLLAKQLDARMRVPCVLLDNASGWNAGLGTSLQSLDSSAFSAAVSRT